MIYLDHAATSYPKSAEVRNSVADYLDQGGNPGRSGHRLAQWSESRIWEARQNLAALVDVDDPDRVIFTLNATMALNVVTNHLAHCDGAVVSSAFEHNSVVRPLHALAEDGRVEHVVVPPSPTEPVDLDRLETLLGHGDVHAVFVSHASNVTGAIAPVEQISALCRRHGVLFVLDAAQTVGHHTVDARLADVLVFAGHKGLGGPQGVGGMVLGEGVLLRPLVRGGSGGKSELREQPKWLPWAHEAGTPNGPGIAGFAAGLGDVTREEVGRRCARERELRTRLRDGLSAIDHVRLHEIPSSRGAVGVLSITLDGYRPTELAEKLDERYGILVRAGLHCAPLAHETLGTFPAGTLRFSLSHLTTEAEIDHTIAAVTELAAEKTAPALARAAH